MYGRRLRNKNIIRNMKELVKHLVKNYLDEIVSKSLLNCHCKGLHSIMLLDSPGKTIRLYIAVKGNEMYLNHGEFFPDEPINKVQPTKKQTISFHAHHCALTLQCIKGEFVNWSVLRSEEGFTIDKWIYKSHINTGKMGFERIGSDKIITDSFRVIRPGVSLYLPANEIHTVCCNTSEESAWLVYEGKEDENYLSVSWSNNDLSKIDDSNLYQKPTEAQVLDLLKSVGLI